MDNTYNPCIGCEYYNKPYWSVVSPCNNCPRINGTGGYVTRTNLTIVKSNGDAAHLPTAEEYREAATNLAFQSTAEWSEPKYQCPKCGGGMCRNERITLTSYPAQYQYQCNKCGNVEYQYV